MGAGESKEGDGKIDDSLPKLQRAWDHEVTDTFLCNEETVAVQRAPLVLTIGWMRLASAEAGASAATRKVGKHCLWLLCPETIQRQIRESSGLLRREVLHPLRPALLNSLTP
jgi:hypothetical protein